MGILALPLFLAATQIVPHKIIIGNYLTSSPNGVAFIVDDAAAFTIDPGGPYYAGTAASDDSYHRTLIKTGKATVTFEWGRVQDQFVGRLNSDAPTDLTFTAGKSWPDFSTVYVQTSDGIAGSATVSGHPIDWQLHTEPVPKETSDKAFTVSIVPNHPVRLVAGFTTFPLFVDVDSTLDLAAAAYQKKRPWSIGDWGNFVAAISDNLNNSRLYASDDHRVAVSVSRGWAGTPNSAPYFCWDSFFNGNLLSLDDVTTGRETIRAILSWQTPEGLVPNFGHWNFDSQRASNDRSQPPVGSMCVWKLNQRWPNTEFLAEVYPKLLKWHRWWSKARDGKHDGLLEWGSSAAGRQGALWETGWDDTVAYEGAEMHGDTLDAYAVDLNSMWAMDADYLARIAEVLGHKADARALRSERSRTLRLMNEKLWNQALGIYCSKLWNGTFITRLTPMNFYPLLAGAPDRHRAALMLKILTDPKLFWGDWVLPTVPYSDPVWTQQNYWRGKVWAPVNYLVFQGLLTYASPSVLNTFAQKSVKLFMDNWKDDNLCGENYLSSTGKQSSDPHYTWGALLSLIGLENICTVLPDGRVRLNGTLNLTYELKNIPIGGSLYEIRMEPQKAILILNGKTVLSAVGHIVEKRI